jgi:hypothetical protein
MLDVSKAAEGGFFAAGRGQLPGRMARVAESN